MYWLVAGLFLIGAVCGATIRFMMFIAVLLGAAAVAVVAGIAHGLVGTAVLDALITVVTLQVGYAAGFVLRATIWSRQTSRPPHVGRERPVPAPIGEKRR